MLRFTIHVLLAVLAVVARASAQEPERLIIYGGVGYVHGLAQPFLSDIARARTPETLALLKALEATTRGAVQQNRFALSAAPVATSSGEVTDLLRGALGPQSGNYTLVDIGSAYSKVYVLAVIGGLELHVADQQESRKLGATADESFFTSATAMLVELGGDLGDNSIALSATAFDPSFERVSRPAGSPLTKAQSREKFARSYARAAKLAIERLAALSQRVDPDALGQDGAGYVMVTGAVLDSPEAAALFGGKSSGPAQQCRRTTICPAKGGEQCLKMKSLLTQGFTEFLSAQGQLTLPPFDFADWSVIARDQGRYLLELPQGSMDALRTLKLDVSENSAEHKFVIRLDRLEQSPRQVEGTTRKFLVDHFVALGVCRYVSEFGRPEAVTGQWDVPGNWWWTISEPRVTGQAAQPALLRGYATIGVWNALKGEGTSNDVQTRQDSDSRRGPGSGNSGDGGSTFDRGNN